MSSIGRRAVQMRKVSVRRPRRAGADSKRCAREVVETVPLVMRFLRRQVRRRSAPSLSVPQVRALALLDREPGSGLSRLAEHLNVARPTASLIVNRLVRQGLVDRAENPHERRRRVLTLTRAGAERLKAVRAVACSVVEQVLSGGNAREIAAIEDGLDRLRVVFERAMRNGRHGAGPKGGS
jgi:DNA-binding MarR family transcriptional regulator